MPWQAEPGPAGSCPTRPCEEPPTRSWSLILSFSIWISRRGLLSRALVMAFWAVMRVAVFRSFTVITDSTGSQMRNWTSAPTESTAPSLEASWGATMKEETLKGLVLQGDQAHWDHPV